MPKTLDSQIRSCIDGFVDELTELVRQAAIESVQEALGAPSSAVRTRRASATGKKTGGKRIRRSAADVGSVGDAVVAFVTANPDCSVTEISAGTGYSSKDLRLPILKLLSEKRLGKTGERRGTRYQPAGRGSASGGAKKKKKAGRKKAIRRKANRRG